ncbi:hypothetical protein MKEN_00358800 [Mycena kentingensis (nom. inval.)]|nr:hypothetical protein MKEN_00358800 [Mycena kentingensis (nom. inval.)]
MKIPTRDAAYSLFGGPLILDLGPTVDGEVIHVHVQPINTISVTALAISLLLFLAFMAFYLYPLLRARRQRARLAAANAPSATLPLGAEPNAEEKSSLMSWLYARSRDRFSTHETRKEKVASPLVGAPSLRNQQSSTRGSLVPDFSTLTPPPPAYASRPGSPLAMAEYRFLSPVASPTTSPHSTPRPPIQRSMTPRSPVLRSTSRIPRPLAGIENIDANPIPPMPARARSNSATLPGTGPNTTLAVRPVMAPRSVSASTLHPASAGLHLPSRARVYSEGETNVRRVPRNGPAFDGISLAARGRQLTRGPSFDANTAPQRFGGAF